MATEILATHASLRKSNLDERNYRCFRLSSNDIRVAVVQDPATVFSAACVNVNVGYFADPEELQGLAHFLEHMVHLGTDKYPDETAYKAFLAQHSGSSNASTSMEHTCYHFKVHADQLQGALDRLAQFFIRPLLPPGAMAREVNAVHAEYSRNVTRDARQMLQLRRSEASAQHPYHKFSTGNKDTLGTPVADPEQSVQVAAQLRALHDAFYRGGNMTVCVLGRESLDQLEALVTECFGGVKQGKASPPGCTAATVTSLADMPASLREMPTAHPYGEAQLGRLYKVAPMRDSRKLEVMWPVPALRQHWASKPTRYVGHLLGHESEGSVLHTLKGRGLLQSLSTWVGDEGAGFAFYHVSMELTQDGCGHMDEILETVYAYLSLLRQGRPHRWIFDEIQATAELDFAWKDKEEPLDLCQALAQRLHYYPPDLLLAAPSLLINYDEQAIVDFLSWLQPRRMTVFLQLSSFAGTTQQKEPWYGAAYEVERLPEELLCRLDNAEHTPDAYPFIHLPVPNRFIATDLSLRMPDGHPPSASAKAPSAGQLGDVQPSATAPSVDSAGMGRPDEESIDGVDAGEGEDISNAGALGEGPSPSMNGADASNRAPEVCGELRVVDAPPTILEESPAHRIWFKPDDRFRMPKGKAFLLFTSPLAYESPSSLVAAKLFAALVTDAITSVAYYAELASLSYDLSETQRGMELVVAGFNDKLGELLMAALDAMLGFKADPRRFTYIKEKQETSLKNWRNNTPASHASYTSTHLLGVPHWHNREQLEALARTEPGDVESFAQRLFSHCYLEAFVCGNFSRKEAATMMEKVLARLRECREKVPASGSLEGGAALVDPAAVRLQVVDLASLTPSMLASLARGEQGGPNGDGGPAILPREEERSAAVVGQGEEGAVVAGQESVGHQQQLQLSQSGGVVGSRVALQACCLDPNPNNADAALDIYFQVGPETPASKALVDLLAQVFRRPCFHQLRTVEQLGYAVSSGTHVWRDAVGFEITLQSPTREPKHLMERVEAFLESFRSCQLASLSEQEFHNHVSSLRAAKLEPPKTLAKLANRAWSEIYWRTYLFDRDAREAEAVAQITHDDLIKFYDEAISASSPSRRIVCVSMSPNSGALSAATQGVTVEVAGFQMVSAFTSPSMHKIHDIPAFKTRTVTLPTVKGYM